MSSFGLMPTASQDCRSDCGMTNIPDISTDPLYLSALASLGLNVPLKLMAVPTMGSIAVLPFLNMSGDPEQEHFTDGLTEDIITDLSNVPGLFVIARHSTFAYKGKSADVRQIARDLGVKYILEGSARRSAQRLRINVQLIDAAEGGNHVWAERFDRDLADIFAVQDEVTRRIVEAISGKLNVGLTNERYRPANLEAYDLCVRSRDVFAQSKSAAREAQANLERAIVLDPNYAEAHWRLAIVQVFNWLYWDEPEEPHRKNAIASAQRAVILDPNDSNTHANLGWVLQNEGRWDEARNSCETARRLNPNDADAAAVYGNYQNFAGKAEEGLELLAMALRLNPRPPGWYYWNLGEAQISCGQYGNAVKTLRREETYRSPSRRCLAAALALSGRKEEALKEAKLFIADHPQWRIGIWAKTRPYQHEKDLKLWIDAFRLAGLPE